MGKAQILSHLGAAKYRARLLFERERIDAQIEDIEEKIENLRERKDLADSIAGFARTDYEASAQSVSGMITAWLTAVANGEDPDPPLDPNEADQDEAATGIAGLVNAHNTLREASGLGTLVVSAALNEAAQAHANWMARNNTLSHTGIDGSLPRARSLAAGYESQSVGENLAGGLVDVEAAMRGWLSSPGHRANIYTPKWQDIGYGYRYLKGSLYIHHWVILFGERPVEPES